MAYKGDNVGSCGDEESSSSSSGAFGEFLSCMDANRVLTWLRLIGDSWANAFYKRFSFIPHVWVSCSTLGL